MFEISLEFTCSESVHVSFKAIIFVQPLFAQKLSLKMQQTIYLNKVKDVFIHYLIWFVNTVGLISAPPSNPGMYCIWPSPLIIQTLTIIAGGIFAYSCRIQESRSTHSPDAPLRDAREVTDVDCGQTGQAHSPALLELVQMQSGFCLLKIPQTFQGRTLP